MGILSRLKLRKLYKALEKNPNVFADKMYNAEKGVKGLDQNKIIVGNLNKDVLGIVFRYNVKLKDDSENKHMRIYYNPDQDYHFYVSVEPKKIEGTSNEIFFNKLDESNQPGLLFNQILKKVVSTVPIKKIRGKSLEAKVKLNENDEVCGYYISLEEIFYKDKSELYKRLYDDLDGLARLSVAVEGVEINKKKLPDQIIYS